MTQTDELMMRGSEEEQSNETPLILPRHIIEDARARLNALRDMVASPGYALLNEALSAEARHCLMLMDKAENPTLFTKFASNHFSLSMATQWAAIEMKRLESLLIDSTS